VNCGRPGTGMPYHLRDAYDGKECYGLSREQLGKIVPQAAATFMRPSEIALVTDYVLVKVKSRGEPSYAECLEFFGEGSRVCNTLKTEHATESGGGMTESK